MRHVGGVLTIDITPVEVDAAFAVEHPALLPGPHVRLTVSDTGHGIAPEVCARIFDPFFTTKESHEGSGMGLAVVQSIIAEHHGSIIVHSTVDQGTTFTIYLPRLSEVLPSLPVADAPIPHGQGRILVVDDEEPSAQVCEIILKRLGYDVAIYTSSLEALEVFRAQPDAFDAVITDQTMPHMTGEALGRALRSIRPNIPIILCTGFSHTMTAENAQAMGIDAFCMKPLLARDLGLALQQTLASRAE